MPAIGIAITWMADLPMFSMGNAKPCFKEGIIGANNLMYQCIQTKFLVAH